MADRISSGAVNFYNNWFSDQSLPIEDNQPTTNVEPSQSQTKPPKFPPIKTEVSFTALGCDTEEKLARAAYMAIAARNGIADVGAQSRFADLMLVGGPDLTLNSKAINDADVKGKLLNREVNFSFADEKRIAALKEFREQYVKDGGKLQFNRTPTIDLREARMADGVSNPLNSTPTKKITVVLNNDGRPITPERILAQFAEDTYKGRNLWGDNYRRIGEISADQGINPKITKITDVGNKKFVEVELTNRDRAVVHENYKTVQAEVNRARAIYEDFANNNEISSFLRGVFNGALGSAKGTIGLLNLPETFKALWQIVSSPRETFNALYEELGKTWEDFKNAPANKKSEMVGELVGAAIFEILLTKGVGKFGAILEKTKTGAELMEKAKLLKSTTTAKIAEAFSDDAAKVARQKFSQKMANQLYSGIPVDALADLAIIATNKVSKGITKFADFSRLMIQELGENVRPQLEKLYREAMQRTGREIDEVEINNTDVSQIARRPTITSANVGSVVVPGVRGGEFASWFNGLTKAEMDVLWTNKTLKTTVEARLRHPGGFHEWLPVSRAPKFREWGIKAEQIWDLRTPTKDIKFVNPQRGHTGSTREHNEIFALIDRASNFNEFKLLLQNWAETRVQNGAAGLPPGLKP